jgi:hypothetical protein
MPSRDQNFEHWAGNARTLKFGPVKDQNNQLMNLFGCTATWAMAKKNTSPLTDIIVEKSTADSTEMEIMEQPAGNFFLLVYLNKDDTKATKQATYYHEATIVDAGGKPDTVAIGKVTLYQTLIEETIG